VQKPTFRGRIIAVLLITVFFVLGYGLFGFIPHYASFNGSTVIDEMIPFVSWFVLFYMVGTIYLFLPVFVLEETFNYAVK
jgi:hypothetical protein